MGDGVTKAVLRRATKFPLYPNWEELLRNAVKQLRAENKVVHANLVSNLLEIGKPEDYLEAARRAFRRSRLRLV